MLEYIKAIYGSHQLEDVWTLHCDAMAKFGFTRMIYGYSCYLTPNTAPVEDSLFLSNHEPGYFKRFILDEMYRYAPAGSWAMENTGSLSWAWVRDRVDTLDAHALQVLELNKAYGVTAGYTIAFAEDTSRSKGAISMASDRGVSQKEVDAIWAKHGREIEAMSNVAHLKIISLPHDKHMPRLSDRQREVLEWVGDGKTNQDIAIILGVKIATVEKHLRLVREKLGVETTAQAVLKASFQNQIFIF